MSIENVGDTINNTGWVRIGFKKFTVQYQQRTCRIFVMCQLFGFFSFDMSSIRHVKNRHFVPYSPEDLAGEEWSDDSSCCLLVTSLL